MHYYQFNIGDYASHTRHLSMMEDLIYRRLLDWYYLNEKPIPSDYIQAARLIQAKDHFPEVEQVLNEFFIQTDDGWINKRADEEIAHFKAKSEQASKAGKASAQARFNGRSTDVQPNNNHKPITNNQETEEKKATSTKSSSITFKQFLEKCEYAGEKRIPENDAVFDYADKVGIPVEMIKVCWNQFAKSYMEKKKRYVDWRRIFRDCVEGNWYKLWFVEADGTVKETSQYRALKKGLENV